MYPVSRLLLSIKVMLLGSTILLSCNNPHATWMDERVRFGRGVDIHRRDHNGATALHIAAWRGDAAVVETLLSQIPETDRVTLIHQRNNYGETALHYAVRRGHAAVVNTLLYGGADIHQSNNDRENALNIAAARGYAAVAYTLLN